MVDEEALNRLAREIEADPRTVQEWLADNAVDVKAVQEFVVGTAETTARGSEVAKRNTEAAYGAMMTMGFMLGYEVKNLQLREVL